MEEEDCSGDEQNSNFPLTNWTHVKIVADFYVSFACKGRDLHCVRVWRAEQRQMNFLVWFF